MTKREGFEDKYNPMKVYASLRFELGIPRPTARELSQWYEDMFYQRALKESDLIKRLNNE